MGNMKIYIYNKDHNIGTKLIFINEIRNLFTRDYEFVSSSPWDVSNMIFSDCPPFQVSKTSIFVVFLLSICFSFSFLFFSFTHSSSPPSFSFSFYIFSRRILAPSTSLAITNQSLPLHFMFQNGLFSFCNKMSCNIFPYNRVL